MGDRDVGIPPLISMDSAGILIRVGVRGDGIVLVVLSSLGDEMVEQVHRLLPSKEACCIAKCISEFVIATRAYSVSLSSSRVATPMI